MFNPPDLDLNVFYVATLNHNATISVVDPRFGFGGTKLLALVPLAARGDDWVLGPGGRQIFVAMPESDRVAIVDTRDWNVSANVPAASARTDSACSPTAVACGSPEGAEGRADSGVTVLDASDDKLLARIRTGRGRHDLAFSDDSRYAFVSNADEGTVSIVDAEALRESAVVKTGRRPYSLAYSSAPGWPTSPTTSTGPSPRSTPSPVGSPPGSRSRRDWDRSASAPTAAPVSWSIRSGTSCRCSTRRTTASSRRRGSRAERRSIGRQSSP